ncbi:hypothetical protein INR49_025926 [Caranx melampygus]|nr:hypothetical protein INR49_025926 [Caranx melampygus]
MGPVHVGHNHPVQEPAGVHPCVVMLDSEEIKSHVFFLLFLLLDQGLLIVVVGSEGSRALPRVYVDDPAGMHVNEVENFMWHGVEAWPWLDVVVVMMGDEDAGGVHGKRPETVEVDLLTHLQGSGHQHQAAAEPFGPDALHGPETLHVEQILWVEEEHASLGVKVVQHVLDSEGYIGVAGVVERWKHHGGVFVILENFVKWPPPFLQLLKSAQEERLQRSIIREINGTGPISCLVPFESAKLLRTSEILVFFINHLKIKHPGFSASARLTLKIDRKGQGPEM